MNRTRTCATNQYTNSCDYVAVVAPIVRVQTDDLVDKRVFELNQRFGSKVALICTTTDVSLFTRTMETD